MKVQLANTEVEIYKLRRGVVVDCENGVGHIEEIGSDVDLIDGKFVIKIRVVSLDWRDTFYSNEVHWLEQH